MAEYHMGLKAFHWLGKRLAFKYLEVSRAAVRKDRI